MNFNLIKNKRGDISIGKISLLVLGICILIGLIYFVSAIQDVISVTLNATSIGNHTVDNLTAHVSPFNSSQKYVYDWRLGGTSIAVLNMPFEDVSYNDYSIQGNNGTKDYTNIDDFGSDGWTENDMTGSVSGGIYSGAITDTSDPFMERDTPDFDESKDRIEIRYKSYSNGPTSIKIYYTDNSDCSGFSEACTQVFSINNDGNWHTLYALMTDAEWVDNDGTIDDLRIDFEGQTATGTIQLDYIKSYPGVVFNSTGGHDGFGAFEFDGVDDLINISGITGGYATATMTAWVKPTEGSLDSGWHNILANENFGYLAINNKKFENRYYDSTSIRSNDNLTADTWYHVAVVYNGTTVYTFVDGVRQSATVTRTGNTNSTTNPFYIGSWKGTTEYFNGTIDEAMIFNRSLSDEQISALYNNRTDLIVSQETEEGEVWQSCATGAYGGTAGNTICSNNLTVRSAMPDISYVILNSTSGNNKTDENLTAYSDASRKPIFYEWFKNGENVWTLLEGPATQIRDSFFVTPGVWRVDATPKVLTDNFDLTNVTYIDETISLSDIRGLAFNNDGTKIYLVEQVADQVREYDLSDPWNASSNTFVHNISVTDHENNLMGIIFNNDGTKMFLVGNGGVSINEFILSTAFDLSTAEHNHKITINSVDQNPLGITFNNDGTRMYIAGSDDGEVLTYNLTTPFTLSTATFSSEFTIGQGETTPHGLTFNNDGTKMFIVGNDNDLVYQFDLSTAFSVDTATYTKNYSIPSETRPGGLKFNKDGTKMFIAGNQQNGVHEYYVGSVTDGTIVQSNSVLVKPHLESLTFNSTTTKNFTAENLTAYPGTLTPNDSKVVYDWRENDTSIAVLNMPFEDHHNPDGYMRDYSSYGNNISLQDIGFEDDGSSDSWTENDITGSASGGIYSAQITNAGGDPYFYRDVTDFDESYNRMIIRYQGYSNGPDEIALHYTDNTDCNNYHTDCKQTFSISNDSEWHVLDVEITDVEWTDNDGTIDDLRFDFEGQSATGTVKIDYIRFYKKISSPVYKKAGGYDGKGAYEFDGDNDNITIADDDSLDITGALTISAWVYIKEGSSEQGILSKGPDNCVRNCTYDFRTSSDATPKLALIRASSSAYTQNSGSGNVSLNEWHHVAVTVDDNDNYAFYIDGAEDSTGTITGGGASPVANSNPAIIGNRDDSYTDFNGSIDDVMLFNRALSAEQIKAIYENKTNFISGKETVGLENWSVCGTPVKDGIEGDSICTSSLMIEPAPNVTGLIPHSNSTYNETFDALSSIEIGANVTDNGEVDVVLANVTLPNGTINQLTLSNTSSWYNVSYKIPSVVGRCNVTFIANDTVGNVNDTVSTYFIVRPYMASLVLNSSLGTNLPSENLTAHPINLTPSDVKVIYDWREDVSGAMKSIAVVNMPFDNGSAIDYSTYSNDGTVNGSTFSATGGYDRYGAYVFNGVNNDSIYLGNDSSLNPSTFTMAYWIKNNGQDADYERITSRDSDSFDTAIAQDGKLRFTTNLVSWTTTNVNVSKGEWHHIVWTHDGSLLKIYKNGVQGYSGSVGQITSTGDFYIGSKKDKTEGFNGSLSDFMYIDRKFSVEQVRALYNNRSDLIVSQETSYGDIWRVCATPTNKTIDGVEVCSNGLTIKPYLDSLVLNSTLLTNLTTENLTAYPINLTPSDSKAIYDWRENGTSIAVVNMPFENEAFDYSIFENDGNLENYTLIDQFVFSEDWEENDMTGSVVEGNYVGNITDTDDPFMTKVVPGFDESYNHLEIRYKSDLGGSPTLRMYYVDGADCSQESETCAETFSIISDGQWHTLDVEITDAEWTDNDGTINKTRFDFNDATSTGTVYIDYIKFYKDAHGPTHSSTGGYDGNGAYEFNGSQYIDLGNDSSLNPDVFTLSYWIKNNGQDADYERVTSYEGNDLETVVDSSDSIRYWAGNWRNTGIIAGKGEWHHIVFSYNGTTVQTYHNGKANYSNAETVTLSGKFRIGCNIAGDECFNGTIDDVMMFNRSLSSEQIKALYDNKTDLIVSNETRAGDNWTVCATPNKNSVDGDKICSNSLEIEFKLDAVILNSTLGTNLTTENLTAYPVNLSPSDADVDYLWLKNNRSYPATPVNVSFEDVVLKMPFENYTQTNDTFKDYSLFENNATVNGSTWNATGGRDGYGAYEFDGTNDGIKIENFSKNIVGSEGLAMMGWVKPYNSTGHDAFFGIRDNSKADFYVLRLVNTTKLECRFANSAGDVVDTFGWVTLDEWNHVAFIYNGSNTFIYINGELSGKNNATGSISKTDVEFYIGRDSDVDYMNGSIDDVMFFNTSLTAEEVKAIYNKRTDLIISQETEVDEIWTVCGTPTKNGAYGTKVCSNNLTIDNFPQVFNLTPFSNSTYYETFNASTAIEIGANVTDNIAVDTVLANVTLPNGTINQLTLNNTNTSLPWYNVSYTIPGVIGRYNVTFIANDTSNNVNSTEKTYFMVKPYFSPLVLNSTLGKNTTDENLTSYPIGLSPNDSKVIYDWREGGSSIAILNMPFDNGSAVDYSSYGNDGTAKNDTFFNNTGGYDGKGAFEFDGASDYIDLGGPVMTETDNVTILAWAKLRATPGSTRSIVMNGHAGNDGYGLRVTSSRNVSIIFGGIGNADSSSQLTVGTWHHVAMRRESGTWSIFLDGVQVSVSNSNTAPNTPASGTGIGANHDGGEGFNGSVDEVMFFNKSLTAEQIKALYGNRTDLIVSQETDVGENWTVCGTPIKDGTDGSTICSNSLAIRLNIDSLVLNSTLGTNLTTENLTAYPINLSPTDAKVVYDWRNNKTGSMASIAVVNMPFENGSAVDYSSYGNDGFVNGSTFNATGGHDGFGAFEFDGTDDMINISGITGGYATATMTAWVKPTEVSLDSGWHNILANENFGYLAINNKKFENRYYDSTSIRSNDNLTADTWYHVAVVYNGTTVYTFVDGVKQTATVARTGNTNTTTNPFYIGSWKGTTEYFNGTIDEAMVFNRSLSDEQVKALYGNRTDLIVSSETNVSDKWSVCGTPFYSGSSGEEVCSNNLTIEPDLISPNVTDLIPHSNSTYNETFNVSSVIEIGANVTDNVEVDSVLANVTLPNGTIVQITLNNTNTSLPWYNVSYTIPEIIGRYNITFIANDTSNNFNTTETTFFVGQDVVNPNVTDMKPHSNSTYNESFNASVSIEIGANITDDVGVDSVLANVTISNGTIIQLTLNRTNTSLPWYNSSYSIPAELGRYNITFIANDSSGNVNSSETTFFIAVDEILPAFANLSCLPNPGPLNATITCNATATDFFGIDNVWANVTIPNGTSVLPNVTNTSSVYSFTFNITDNLNRYNVTWHANDTNGNNNEINTSFEITQPVINNVSCSPNPVNLTNSIVCEANVTSGTASSVDSVLANVTMANGTVISQSINNYSEIYNFTFSNTVLIGVYNVSWFANDTEAYSSTRSHNFTVRDVTAPNVTDLVPHSNSTYNETYNVSNVIEIGANVTDNYAMDTVLANVTIPNGTIVQLTLTNTSSWYNSSYTIPYVIGRYNITFIANDTSNNTNLTETTFFVGQDVTNPNITEIITINQTENITNITVSQGENITINVTITDDVEVDRVWVKVWQNVVGGVVWFMGYLTNIADNLWQIIIPTNSTWPIGDLNYTIYSNDTSGNEINRSVNSSNSNETLTILDSYNPQVTGLIPHSNSTYNETFNVSTAIEIGANVTDNVAVDAVLANVTIPNGTVVQLSLSNVSQWYNISYTIPYVIGRYNVTFIANDSSGNINSSETTFFFGQDVVAPNVTGSIPHSNSTYNETFNVSTSIEIGANVTDDVEVDNVLANVTLPNSTIVQLTLNNSVNNWYNSSYTIPALIGRYNVTFIANDTSNNTNLTETTFFVGIDVTNPQVTGLIPHSNSTYNKTYNVSNVIEIGTNVTDDVEVDTVLANVTIPNGTVVSLSLSKATSDWYNISYTIPGGIGRYNITFIANDTSNNTNLTETTFFVVQDVVAPNVTGSIPHSNSTYNETFNVSTSIEIGANVTDDVSVSVVLANVTMPNGTVTQLTLTNTSNWYNSSYTIPALIGRYNVTFIANDTSNNTNLTETTFFVGIDVTNPNVTGSIPHSNSTYNETYNVSNVIEIGTNVTDDILVDTVLVNVTIPNGTVVQLSLSNISQWYNISYTIPYVIGRYNVTFIANDSSNNINSTETTFFIAQDITNPQVTGLIPHSNSTYNETYNVSNVIEIGANVTDDVEVDSVLANVTISNGTSVLVSLSKATGDWYNSSYAIPTVVGRYNVTFIANDTSNNLNATEKTFFVVQNLEFPNVTDLIPHSNSTYNETFNVSSTIEVGANVTSNVGVDTVSVNLTISNGTVVSLSLSKATGDWYNVSYVIPNVLGRYNVTFIANDTSGNVNSTETTFFVGQDVTNPNVTGLIPHSNSTYNETYNVSNVIEIGANVTDDVEVDTVLANVTLPNSTIVQLTLNNSVNNWYNSSYTIPYIIGRYNITFIANDTSDNLNATETTYFIVQDVVAPNVTGLIPHSNSTYNETFNVSTSIEIGANVTDDVGVNITLVNITLPNSTIVQLTLNNSVNNWYNVSYTIPYVIGRYNITFIANDTSGNVNSTETTFFVGRDVTYPNITKLVTINESNISSSGTVKQGDNFTLNVTVSDDVEVDSVWVKIWKGAIGGAVLFMDYLSNIVGNLWQIVIPTNSTWPIGDLNYTVYANDTSGNEINRSVNASNSNETLTILDSYNPNVTDLKPHSNSTYNETFNVSTAIEIGANVTDNVAVDSVLANVTLPNSTVVQITLSNAADDWYNVSYTVSELQGRHNITYIVNDTSGNINSSEKTFFMAYDNVAPAFSNLSCKPNPGPLNATITCNATVKDFLAVDSVWSNVTMPNGTSVVPTVTNTSSVYSFTFNRTSVLDRYNVTWNANDTNGNEGNTTSSFDITQPVINNVSCSPNPVNLTNSTVCTANITSGTASSVDAVLANVTMANGTVIVQSVNNYSEIYNFTFSNTAIIGVYNVSWFANDTEGYSTTRLHNFTVRDVTNPQVTGLIPHSNSTYNETYNVSNVIEIGTNVTDNVEVDTVLANVTIPNGTVVQLSLSNTSQWYNVSYTIPYVIGRYNITFIANDTSNNTNLTETTFFVGRDVTNPQVTGLIPHSNSTYNETFNVSTAIEIGANVTDNVAVDAVLANVTIPNGTVVQLSLSNISQWYNISYTIPYVIGRYNVTFIANDSSNNINSTETTFFIAQDITNPQVTGLIPHSNSTYNETFNVSTSIEIGANVTDDVEVDSVLANVTISNGTIIQLTLNRINTSLPWYNVSYTIPRVIGRYNITFVANDTSNNLNATETTYFIVQDVTVPNITQMITINGSNVSVNTSVLQGENITINVTVSDDVEVDSVWVKVWKDVVGGVVLFIGYLNNIVDNLWQIIIPTNSTWPIGDLNYTIYSNDTSGNEINRSVNSSNSNETLTILDSYNPNVTGLRPVANTSYNVSTTIEVGANVTDNVEVDTVLANVTMPNGTVTQLTLVNTSNWYNSSYTIPSVIGQYNITFIANDTSNNLNATETTFFVGVDAIAPNIQFVNATTASGNYSQNFIYSNVTASDNVELDTITIRLYNSTALVNSNSSKVSVFSHNFTSLSDGVYYLNATANDTSNNVNSTSTRTIVLDTTNPVVNIISPPNNSQTSDPTPDISFNLTDNLDSNIQYRVYVDNTITSHSGTGNAANSSSTTVTITSALSIGDHNITVEAIDNANNTFNQTINISITPPVVYLMSPSYNQTMNSSDVTFVFNVTDTSFTNLSCSLYINDILNQTNSTTLAYNATNFTVAGIADGLNQNWTVNCTNAANASAADTWPFGVDTIFPQINFTSPTTASGNYSQNWIYANVSVSDNLAMDTIIIRLYNSTGLVNSSTSATTPFSLNFTSLNDGTYYLNATVNDSANNLNLTGTRTIVLDRVAPNVTDLRPIVNTTYNVSTTIEVGTNVTDDIGVSLVLANVTLPNSTVVQITLSNATGDWYNVSYTIPTLSGRYNVTFIANDTLNNINSTEITYFIVQDVVAPNVTDLRPIVNTTYNVSNVIEIGANVTDNVGVSAVLANLTLPNGTITQLTLTNTSSWYNVSYTVPNLAGQYNVTFIANDTSNNLNITQTTYFIGRSSNLSVILVSPANATTDTEGNVTFVCNASNIALANLTLYVWNSTGNIYYTNTTNVGGESNQTNWTLNNIADGDYNWNCLAYDTSNNNTFAENNRTFTVLTVVTPLSVNTIECSNDSTVNWYFCANMTYGTSITHIRANVTTTGNISDVRFNLYNLEDNTNYKDNQPYTYNISDSYIYNSSYLLRDSGTWNLSVTASGDGNTSVNSTSWNLAWGNVSIGLIDPATDTSVVKNKFFPFSANVSCSGGECGIVNVTLDPYEAINDTCGRLTSCENISVGEDCVNETVESCEKSCEMQEIDVCENITVECGPKCEDVCVEYEDINGTQGGCIDEEQQCEPCEDDVVENCTTEEKEVCEEVNCTENIIENCTDIINQTCIIEVICNSTQEGEGDSEEEEISLPETNDSIKENVTRDEIVEFVLNSTVGEARVVLYKNVSILQSELVFIEEDENIIGVMTDEFNETKEEFNYLTPILAVELSNNSSATVYLPKLNNEEINIIKKCEVWNYEEDKCEGEWFNYATDFEQDDEKIWFRVESFSAYAGGNATAGETAFLKIWDENDVGEPGAVPNTTSVKIINDNVTFFADYKVAKNATKIVDGNCIILINGSVRNMTSNGTYYNYTMNMTAEGVYGYTINCSHSVYTNLSANKSIIVGLNDTSDKGGAVPTSYSPGIPFYTNSSNPQQTSNLRGGDSQTIIWDVNSTGILGKVYDFFVEANGTYVNYTTSSHVNLTITANDTTVPVFIWAGATNLSAQFNGSSVTINANVEDGVQVDSVWGIVTHPSGFNTSFSSVPFNFTNTTEVGKYNLTFYANDSSGNNVTYTTWFETGEPMNATINVTVNVSVEVGVNISSNFTFRLMHPEFGDVILEKEANGSFIASVPDVVYDVLSIETFNKTMNLTLKEVNLSANQNESINLDKHKSISDYLVTYGVDTNYSFNISELIFSYVDLKENYSVEGNLRLWICNNYSFSGRNCSDNNWSDVTNLAKQNTDEHYFYYNTTSFSGFSINEFIPEEIVEQGRVGGLSDVCVEGYERVGDECVRIVENLTDEDEEVSDIIEQLFDITWTIEDSVIQSSSVLEGVVTFESFGTVPTPVNLTFIVLDINGNEVYRVNSDITVTTEEIMRWTFEGLSELPDGEYVAVLNTLYNVDVFDEFRQEFRIEKSTCQLIGFDFGKFIVCWYWWVLGGFIAIALIVWLIWWLIRRPKKVTRIIRLRKVVEKPRKIIRRKNEIEEPTKRFHGRRIKWFTRARHPKLHNEIAEITKENNSDSQLNKQEVK